MRASISLLVIAVLTWATTAGAQSNVDLTAPIPHRIVIKMKPGFAQLSGINTGFAAFDSLNTAFGLKRLKTSSLPGLANNPSYVANRLGDYYALYFDTTAPPPESLLAYYQSVPQIEEAYEEYWYVLFGEHVPCDPLFDSQWNLRSTAGNFGDSGIDIGASQAWDAFQGAWDDDNSAVIAVIDDGVNKSHWELATGYGTSAFGPRDNFAWNEAEKEGAQNEDDDGNEFVDDWLGWDFNGYYDPGQSPIDADNDVSAVTGHGTAVSTVAAAETDSLPGHSSCSDLMAGVSWYSRILPIKATPTWTVGDTTYYVDFLDPQSVREAVAYSILMGADIMNCSFGRFSGAPLAQDSVQFLAAYQSGVAIFAAAGTCFGDPEAGKYPAWPAAFDFVFAVGAVDGEGQRKTKDSAADWASNYVNPYETERLWLDAMAPGVQIVSGWRTPNDPSDDEVRFDWGGTSAAAPQAAGVGALLKARYPWLTNDDIYYIMRYSSRDELGRPTEDLPGWDRHHGWGLLSADRAINMIMPVVNESPEDGVWVQGQPTFTWRYVPVVNYYHVQVAYDTAFTSIVVEDTNVAYATWVPPSALPETTLYWRVRYNVPTGWQPFTEPTSIRVDADSPAMPPLLSPGDECFYTDSSAGIASFYWSEAASYSPIRYTLQYSTDSAFQTNVRGDSNLVDTAYTDSTFTDNRMWYWRVDAVDSAGYESGWPSSPPASCIAAKVGDVNADSLFTAADLIYLVNYAFSAGPEPIPHELVGNVNECDEGQGSFLVTAADVVYLSNYLFKGGDAPCGLAYPEGCGHD